MTTRERPRTSRNAAATAAQPQAQPAPEPPPGLAAAAAVPPCASDADAEAQAAARRLDQLWNAQIAAASSGLSPVSLALAWTDWAMQSWQHPGHASLLLVQAQRQALERLHRVLHPGTPPDDPRFADADWGQWPWNLLALRQMDAEAWWDTAAALPGMDPHHQRQVRFLARQMLETASPANHGFSRPDVLRQTAQRQGTNLALGLQNAHGLLRRQLGLQPVSDGPPRFVPGVDVAVTPGKVVHRNHLAELIQYAPTTRQVQREPVFIVPSWIMKYYILDLSPHNSMVRWLVDQGHTVFILSWRNPDASDALLGMQDYLDLGVRDMLAAIGRLLPDTAVHAAGYCLGGTLLAIAAAALGGRPADAARLPPLRSLTLLAAETDFSEPGEMGVLIDEAQVSMLEDMMAERGYLTGAQMAGSFTFLHARDLFWAQRINALWLGEADQPNDLMAWNADATRMPAAMHSEYLRRCFLRNELAQHRFPVDGRPVSLQDIVQPVFMVGTERDHVAPWRSVYKLHRLCPAEITFALASGGHNAGIVSEPGHAHRHFSIGSRPAGATAAKADEWLAAAQRQDGSWWPAWSAWLQRQGSGELVPARSLPVDAPDAPGENVLVRWRD